MAVLNLKPSTPDEAIKIIIKVARMRVDKRPSIMLHGEPGSGKSTIVHTVSKILFGKKAPTVHLGLLESYEIKGIPLIDREANEVRWVQPDFLVKMAPGIVFFDEITQARRDTLAASYGIFLDRCIDGKMFPDDTVIIAAGNDTGDGAIANEMGTALNDRFLHIWVVPDALCFLKYHENRGMHPAVMALIHQMPQLLSNNKERIESDHTVGMTMRAWESVSGLLETFLGDNPKSEDYEENLSLTETVISGRVGIFSAGHLILTIRDINECADPRVLLQEPLSQVERQLPSTIRGGIALAFAFGHICKTSQGIAKAAAIMTLFERKDPNDLKTTDGALPMLGREIATLGVERLLRKAEELNLIDDIVNLRMEGSDILLEYIDKTARRHHEMMRASKAA